MKELSNSSYDYIDNSIINFYDLSITKIILGGNMRKIAITLRKKDDNMTFFMNQTYFLWLLPYFNIELVVPRGNHQYKDIVERNDLLLICGGNDINPFYYHQKNHPSNTIEDPLIETMDFALLQQFYHAHKPIIGICRGIQVINVFFKGTLFQDIPSISQVVNHSHTHHQIKVIDKTFLAKYFPHQSQVNSFHHQNIDNVSPLFHINAISEDGFIEGIENHQIIAVQWHPERMDKNYQETFIHMIIDFIDQNKTSDD